MDGSSGPVQFETVIIGGDPVLAHSDAVVEVHERILDASPARSRHIEVRSGRRVHVIEAGQGPPVLFLHGGSTSSLSLLSLLERLEGVRAIAVDRPGFGLSDPVHVPRERYRDAAIEFLDEILDELSLEMSALAGSSLAPNASVGSCCWGRPPSCPAPVSWRPCE
jgi:pimeloyl-ACP methyl ester carboxylesterase